MTGPRSDEEIPLLSRHGRTPLPWFQFFIILFVHLAEPLSALVINPFAPQLVRDIGVTHGEEARVGYYVGMLQSIFYLAQAMTILYWSQLSDRIGRKPVLLMGLLGSAFALLFFGLSKTYGSFLISRFLSGALDGNIGVFKSILVEITDSTNVAQAFSYLPITWAAGASLAAMIGGFFVYPAKRFPAFKHWKCFEEYPAFLPCALSALLAVVAGAIAFLYLKETVPSPFPLRRFFHRKVNSEVSPDSTEMERGPPFRSLLTRRVIIATMNYACFAMVDISFRAILPLFLSTPIEHGGLGLPPSDIGTIISIHAFLNGLVVALFFSKVHDRWGAKRVFTASLASGIPVYAAFPILSVLARSQGLSATVYMVVAIQLLVSVMSSFAMASIFIYIAASAPDQSLLGATNGFAQMTVSIVRSIAPAAATSLFSISMDKKLLGGFFVYWVMVALVVVSMMMAFMLP